jgi:hypothetical protein
MTTIDRSWMRRALTGAAFSIATVFVATQVSPAAAQDNRVRTGTLRCNVSPGVAIVVGSRSLSCTFRPVRGPREVYTGQLTKVGLNLGVTNRGVLVWGVLEPAGRHHSIAGTYVGATGEASVGVGVGANALVGGSNNNVALQPLSIQGQTGLNIALGGASLELRRR